VPRAEKIRFIQEARKEFNEAVRWYAGRDPAIAEAFSDAVKRFWPQHADARFLR
jgi:hypothetical protein